MPSFYHSITGIDFTFHPQLYVNHTLWINHILPRIILIVTSFRLKYVYLFSHRDVTRSCPLDKFHSQIQRVYPTWFLSIHTLSSSSVSTYISCFRSHLYLSAHKFPSNSPFHVFSTLSFPTVFTWLSSLFNTIPFSLFTYTAIPSSSPMGSHRDLFCPQFSSFVHNDKNLVIAVKNFIINPMFPALEPSLHSGASIFDGWFDIPFQDSLHTTHIRAPHSSKILTLYNLHSLVPLYPSLLSSKNIRYLVLRTLPSCLSNHTASVFLSTILPPPISPPPFTSNLSSCFALQPLPARKQWFTAYKDDPDTNFLMEHLRHNALMDRLCITKLAVTYRKAIAHNLLCIVNCRLVYLESVIVSTNHVCRIIVPLSLPHIIFNAMHPSPSTRHIAEHKTLYRLKFRFFWPRNGQILRSG